MSDLIEKVAKAIHASDKEQWGLSHSWETLPAGELHRGNYRRKAVAAVEVVLADTKERIEGLLITEEESERDRAFALRSALAAIDKEGPE